MNPGWRVYSGVVHVHTDQSGGASFERILDAARACKVDFIVLTDTNIRMQEAVKLQGWHGDIFVLVGEQVVAPNGTFLAFDVPEEIGLASNWEHALDRVHAQAGSAVGTHYHFRNANLPSSIPAPIAPDAMDLVELWSFHDEFVANAKGRMALQFHARPERLIVGPPKSLLREWDEQLKIRNVPAVGSVNALCRKEPLLDWKEFFDCNVSFNTVRTNVLCPPLPRSARTAASTLWRALRRGYSYLVNHGVQDPAGFDFYYEYDDETFTMGESVLYAPGGRLHVELPVRAEVILWHNGSPLFWGTTDRFSFPAPSHGVARVEVRIDRRVWIMSNAIRLVNPNADLASVRPESVMEFT